MMSPTNSGGSSGGGGGVSGTSTPVASEALERYTEDEDDDDYDMVFAKVNGQGSFEEYCYSCGRLLTFFQRKQ
jgi:hypothetical protein